MSIFFRIKDGWNFGLEVWPEHLFMAPWKPLLSFDSMIVTRDTGRELGESL